MNIKLKTISIENFKGIRQFMTGFGFRTSIFGANASGKTTLMDAFTWLLFDRDSQGSNRFDIRPLGPDGKMIDNIEISVEATLKVDDAVIKLKKTQKQVWTKKRGSDAPTFTGNKNEFEIDEFPTSETEYKAKVASLIDANLFKLITDPKQFASMKWQDQRELLMKLITDVTDETILAAGGEKYSPIRDEILLGGAEKTLLKAKKTMTELKKKQDELPVRIDEASKQLVDVPELADLELKRNEIMERLNAVKVKKDSVIEAGKGISEASNKLMALHKVLAETEMFEQKKVNKLRFDARSKVDGLQELITSLKGKKSAFEHELTNCQTRLAGVTSSIEAVREEYLKVRGEDMPDDALICPTCGQKLPEDKAGEVIEKWGTSKRARLENITERGNSLKKQMMDLSAEVGRMEGRIAHVDAQLQSAEDELVEAQRDLDALPETADLDSIASIIDLRKQIAEQEELLNTEDDGAEQRELLRKEEEAIQDELYAVNKQFAIAENNSLTEERLKDLREEQREVGQLVALQEQKIYLLEEFSRAKMDAMSEGINRCFEKVNFKLFDMQINGGMRETCEMTMNGVPYSSLNSAAKMQAGLDVIRTLSRLYNVTAPIWCDNRESVTDIPEMDAQVISLYVSPGDKELRVEEG